MAFIKRQVFFVVMFAALVLTACSAQGSQPAQTGEAVTVPMVLNEFAYSPNTIQAKVGQELTLQLSNTGALEHEIMIGRQVKTTESRPAGYQTDMFAEAHVEPVVKGLDAQAGDMASHDNEHTGFMVVVPPGAQNVTVTFPVTKEMVGEWEIGCFLQQGVHYDAGMKGKLVVTE